MAKSYLLTITVTILLVCIYHGETVDSPAKPANGIQKPPVDKPGQPPVAKPPTQAKPPAAKPPTQAKPPVANPPTQAKPPANPPAKPPAQTPAKPPTHSKRTTPHGTHGGVPMGIPTPYCDDGIRKVQIDYDKRLIRKVCSPRFCTNWQKKREISILKKLRAKKTLPVATSPVVKPDDCKNDLKTEGLCCTPPQEAIHKCLNEKITYDSPIPTSGVHRPLWPKYGEYAYLPPQRWIHNLEHGGIVFLYHPCADQEQINQLRTIAFSCLYKIIITPSNKLAVENPFAVLSWGCRLLLPDVNKEKITAFIKEKALTAPESYETKEGQFDRGLIRPVGQIVYEDARGTKCPEKPQAPKVTPKPAVNGNTKHTKGQRKHYGKGQQKLRRKDQRKLRRRQCKDFFMLVKGKWGQKWGRRRKPWKGRKNRWKPRRKGQKGGKYRGKARWKGKKKTRPNTRKARPKGKKRGGYQGKTRRRKVGKNQRKTTPNKGNKAIPKGKKGGRYQGKTRQRKRGKSPGKTTPNRGKAKLKRTLNRGKARPKGQAGKRRQGKIQRGQKGRKNLRKGKKNGKNKGLKLPNGKGNQGKGGRKKGQRKGYRRKNRGNKGKKRRRNGVTP